MTDNERVLRMLGWTVDSEDDESGAGDVWLAPLPDCGGYWSMPDPRDHPATVLAALKWMLGIDSVQTSRPGWILDCKNMTFKGLNYAGVRVEKAKGDTLEDLIINGLIAYCNENGWPKEVK